MAIGTTAAIIGGSVLGVGGSILSSRAQSRAAGNAADVSRDTSQQQINLARDIFNQQRDDLAPARDFQLQQMNGLGEVFGFNPVGQEEPQTSRPSFSSGFNSTIMRDFRDLQDRYGAGREVNGMSVSPRAFLPKGSGSVQQSGGIPNFHVQPDGRVSLGGYDQLTTGTETQTDQPTTMQTQQDAARARFEGSMFNDVYREGHARDVDRIDAGLGAQGLAFSGARMQAVEDARADRFGSTFNSYLSAMMGQAPQSATNATNAAAGQYGATASNAIGQNGQNLQQSAYAQGQVGSNLWGGVSQLGGFAAGGGFGGSGNKS